MVVAVVVVGGGGEWVVAAVVVVSVLCSNNGHRYHFHRHQLAFVRNTYLINLYLHNLSDWPKYSFAFRKECPISTTLPEDLICLESSNRYRRISIRTPRALQRLKIQCCDKVQKSIYTYIYIYNI